MFQIYVLQFQQAENPGEFIHEQLEHWGKDVLRRHPNSFTEGAYNDSDQVGHSESDQSDQE